MLRDKAELAGITVHLVDERGTSSTCPTCRRKITKPAGRTMTCRHRNLSGHRDLFAAATIATRTRGIPGLPRAAAPAPQRQQQCCRRRSRTVEQDDTFPVPDCPGVTPADPHRTVMPPHPATRR
ncbi:zinc ribbon domain-containing protein [Dactylosporangium sp. NPDC049742]|uniref:zinc ribbon domain-containing protein n=1 Tax=Dactylosporangium sp. NPDC049742 TaxID=3154737 RepID=UPI0034432F6C